MGRRRARKRVTPRPRMEAKLVKYVKSNENIQPRNKSYTDKALHTTEI